MLFIVMFILFLIFECGIVNVQKQIIMWGKMHILIVGLYCCCYWSGTVGTLGEAVRVGERERAKQRGKIKI